MEEADLLCDSLFRWLEKRKKCADKLLELAQQLEDVNLGSNAFQVVGAATSVVSISGALVATFLTGGLASPLLAAATAGTIASTVVSVMPPLVEAGISRITLNKATELSKEDEKVGRRIQKQLQDLKDRCGGTQLGDHADELDCEVTTQLMGALARRDNTHIPLDFLRDFNRATVFRHLTPGGLDSAEASRFIGQALGIVSFSAVIAGSLMLSAEAMGKKIGSIGVKAAAKAGSRVLGAIGLGICVYDLIDKSEELVKDNRVTDASELLRDSAREILEGRQKLKEQLDAMHEIIKKLEQVRNLVKNLGGYSLNENKNGQKVIDYIMGTCTDSTVVSWLRKLTHQIEFVNLLRFYMESLEHIFEKLRRPGGGHINIVIVAHGRIVDQFMPAGGLVPTPNIIDTILYSPWNCSIDSRAAFGIAQGIIEVTNRKFRNRLYCEPNPLPQHWNSMRRSLHNIPGILLSPVTPEDKAWAFFDCFWESRSMKISDRIIIPYLVPKEEVKAFGEIPLYMFIFLSSFILMLYGKTATVHLAACLDRAGSPKRPVEWRRQYAYTNDGTVMTMNLDNKCMNSMFFSALRSMFDRR
ncbi:uncharacterized protein LOC125267164 [Megalobrama amblycephala]|uniref:uncharacterized protein LOC125267164 n=1 Tax=Megalobrama amblycephala TaxID=75352 RepID=UPI00201405D8|nr:uncharacterized protein LOC125267164 [Megalobrama amblycephala]XP_048044482.1 uncharacterized protein LOC125267164 [Megalobrama amblycephala]